MEGIRIGGSQFVRRSGCATLAICFLGTSESGEGGIMSAGLGTSHTRRVLELPETLRLIAGYASSAAGRERISALTTMGGAPKQALVKECVGLLRRHVSLPTVAFESFRSQLARVRREGVILDTEDFQQLRCFLDVVDRLHRFGRRVEGCQALPQLANRLTLCVELRERIDQIFDRNGEIVDRASERLGTVRREIRQLNAKLNKRLEGLLRASNLQDALQEAYIDLRNGRHVIPVRRELRSRVPGIVHDQSNSGRTLFVEPQALVELGNDLTTLRIDERDECRRILAELSDQVREQADALDEDEAALSAYDGAYAVACWARDYGCHYAPFGKALVLKDARHPLLDAQMREANCSEDLVPLEMRLGVDIKVLAVTGSNSGGKTIVLKTVGLLSLLGHLGLPIPSEPGSQLRRFVGLHADIGDEQSLQQNLSTFSAHMQNISGMFQDTSQGVHLVLLDELCAGTDPVEGGSLACGILEELACRETLTIVTTHLGMVKHHVQQDPRMLNSTVLFNRQTLAPEYRLILGRPGASHAFDVARRFGIPDRVIGASRARTGSDNVQMEDVLSSLQDQDREMQDKLREVRKNHAALQKERDSLQKDLEALRKERKRMLFEARTEAKNIVDNARRDMDKMLRKANAAQSGHAKGLREEVRRKSERLGKGIAETREKLKAPEQPAQDPVVGDWVRVELLGEEGTLVKLDKGRAHVEINGKRFQVPASQLAVAKKKREQRTHVAKPAMGRTVARELNLIGLRVDEALPKLQAHLSDAILAGLPELHIIHGRGTGRLRDAVHQTLRQTGGIVSHRLAKFGELPGSDGVTIVTLKKQART